MLGGAVALTVATALIPLALAANSPAVGVAAIVGLWLIVGLGWSSVETPVGRIIRRSVDRADLPAAFAAQFSLRHACGSSCRWSGGSAPSVCPARTASPAWRLYDDAAVN